MIQKFISSLFITILFFITVNSAYAQTKATPNCEPIYGGGQTCLQVAELAVDLQIKNPQTNAYVQSLNAAGPTMNPGQQINYRLTVKNTVNREVAKVSVTIIFPQLVDYVSGTGKFDSKTRKLTFPIEKLKANETKTLTITGKVAPKDKLSSQTVTCTFTQALATIDKKTSQDNTQFCINPKATVAGTTTKQNTSKGGLTVYAPSTTKTTPQTGPEALALIGLLPAGALGIWLRRKSSR